MPDPIYLAPDDDVLTVRATLAAGAYPERPTEVVAPHGQKALNSEVGILVLRRWVEDAGQPLHIVTNDARIRRLAGEQGLSCSNRTLDGEPLTRVLQAQSVTSTAAYARYHRERRELQSARLRTFRSAVLGAALLLLPPLAGGWVILPSATVTLQVSPQPVDETLTITVDTLATRTDAENSTLPGRSMEVPVEIVLKDTPTGAVSNPDTIAKGSVTLVNRTNEPVQVPAGTRISTTSNVAFLTQSAVTLPPVGVRPTTPANESPIATPTPAGATPPARVEVQLAAEKPGVNGNIAPREALRLEDATLNAKVVINNETPFAGGVDSPDLAVTEADYQRLKAKALETARERGLADIEGRLATEGAVAPGSLRVRVLTEDVTPAIGQPGDSMQLTVRAVVRAMIFNRDDLRNLVRKQMNAGDDQKEAPGTKLSVSIGKVVSSDNDVAVFETHVQGAFGRWLDEGKVRQLVAGKTPTDARNLLLSLAPASSPRVSLTTFWADRVPPFPFRITVRQNYAS